MYIEMYVGWWIRDFWVIRIQMSSWSKQSLERHGESGDSLKSTSKINFVSCIQRPHASLYQIRPQHISWHISLVTCTVMRIISNSGTTMQIYAKIRTGKPFLIRTGLWPITFFSGRCKRVCIDAEKHENNRPCAYSSLGKVALMSVIWLVDGF